MKAMCDIIRNQCPPLAPLPTSCEPMLSRFEGARAVLFDVYGTLFVSDSGDVGTAAAKDTEEALTEALDVSGFTGKLQDAGRLGKECLKSEILAWHKASRAAGTDYPEVDIVQVWERVVDLLRRHQVLDPATIDIEPFRQLAIEYECRVNPVYPMPGCREILRSLKERGVVMGIVSNAQFYTPLLFRAFFDETIDQIGFDPDCCIWSYKELKAKPSADLFPKAEKYLKRNHGIKLSQTVYVGNDMLNDVYTASQAGCKTVLFAGDQRSLRLREADERCAGLQPNAVITSMDQLGGLFPVLA